MDKSKKTSYFKYLIITFIVIIVLWFLIPCYIINIYGNPKGSGELGDVFGSVNALFSAFAFVLLIYTALLQREELKLQRIELQLTRKELEKSAEAQSTLVALTQRQYDLSVISRRLSIRPELAYSSLVLNSVSTFIGFYFRVKKNRLMFESIHFDKDTYKHFELHTDSSKYINFFEVEDSLVIGFNIIDKKFESSSTIEFSFIIKYRDIDGELYYQLYQNNPQTLSPTRLVSATVL